MNNNNISLAEILKVAVPFTVLMLSIASGWTALNIQINTLENNLKYLEKTVTLQHEALNKATIEISKLKDDIDTVTSSVYMNSVAIRNNSGTKK